MIVKFQMHNGWVFVSDLYKVETKEMLKKDAQDLAINKEFYCMNEEEVGNTVWVKLHYLFTREIGFNKIVVTDINQVYLLNDEGKTIERIN
jgi:hypothetical protein